MSSGLHSAKLAPCGRVAERLQVVDGRRSGTGDPGVFRPGTALHGCLSRADAWSCRMKATHIHMAVALLFTALLRPATGQPAMFAGYDEFCSLPVIVIPNPFGASAARDPSGRPVIYVDPGVMSNWTSSRMFALAHECGHHKIGHTTPRGQWFRYSQGWATRVQELEADCWAAEALALRGYSGDLRRQFDDFLRQGGASLLPNYPSGMERAETVARCAGMSGGRDEWRRRPQQ